MEISETAAAIMDFFSTHEWLKGHLMQFKGTELTGACLLGAELEVCRQGDPQRVTAAVGEIAAQEWPERLIADDWWADTESTVVKGVLFNNHPDTTYADMERCLQKVAAREVI